MLSQRLLDILRIFNNPENFNLVQNFELIPQDIEFLRKNGLRVDILESHSMTALCKISRGIIIEKKSNSIIIYYETREIKASSPLITSAGIATKGDLKAGDLVEAAFIEDIKNGIILKHLDYRQNPDDQFENNNYVVLYFRVNSSSNNKPLEFKNQELVDFQIPSITFAELWINELRITPRDLYEVSEIIALKTGRKRDDIINEFIKILCEKAENLDGIHHSLKADDEIGAFFGDDEDGHINAIIELLDVIDEVLDTNFLTLYQIAHENANQRILRRTIKQND